MQSDVVGTVVLEKLLQSWGVQVQRANGLEQARRLGAEWQPDFVLCDQSLQNAENGFECLEQLLEQTEADELIFTCDMYDFADRLHAFDILAELQHG